MYVIYLQWREQELFLWGKGWEGLDPFLEIINFQCRGLTSLASSLNTSLYV